MMRLTLALALLTAPALTQDVWVVDISGNGDFTQPQAAVNAAGQRDTILIRPGTYIGFTIANKGLQLLSETGLAESVVFTSPVYVRGLPEGRDVWFQGLQATWRLGDQEPTGVTGGTLLLEGCRSRQLNPLSQSQVNPLEVRRNLASLVVTGGEFVGATSPSHGYDPGGAGLLKSGLDFSRIVVHDATLRGGTGASGEGFGTNPGGNGGPGLSLQAGRVYHAHTVLQSGSAGWGSPSGFPGVPILLGAGATQAVDQTPVTTFNAPSYVSEGQTYSIQVTGPVGAQAVLLSSDELQVRELPVTVGVLHLESPLSADVLGTIPASGILTVQRTAPMPPAGVEGQRRFSQLMVVQNSARYLAEVRGQVVIQ